MINDIVDGKNVPRYLVYDIVKFEVRLPYFIIYFKYFCVFDCVSIYKTNQQYFWSNI